MTRQLLILIEFAHVSFEDINRLGQINAIFPDALVRHSGHMHHAGRVFIGSLSTVSAYFGERWQLCYDIGGDFFFPIFPP